MEIETSSDLGTIICLDTLFQGKLEKVGFPIFQL